MFKKILIVIGVLCVIGFGCLLINNQKTEKVVLGATNTVAEFSDGQIIDVREPSEYLAGHADGAINIPLGDILAGKSLDIDKNDVIYVYCRSGVRAGQAKVQLEKDGYKHVTSIGGLADWENDGGKVCKTDKPKC